MPRARGRDHGALDAPRRPRVRLTSADRTPRDPRDAFRADRSPISSSRRAPRWGTSMKSCDGVVHAPLVVLSLGPRVAPPRGSHRPAREPVQEMGRALIGKVQDLFYGDVMKPRVFGRAHIPHNRNVIVVANHASHLDMGLVRHALGKYGEAIVSLAAHDYFFDRSCQTSVLRESDEPPAHRPQSVAAAVDPAGGRLARTRQDAPRLSRGHPQRRNPGVQAARRKLGPLERGA